MTTRQSLAANPELVDDMMFFRKVTETRDSLAARAIAAGIPQNHVAALMGISESTVRLAARAAARRQQRAA